MNKSTQPTWDAQKILGVVRGFQPACVIVAGAELGLFDELRAGPLDAAALTARLRTDPRALRILADALVALGLLGKAGDLYSLAPGVADALTETGTQSVLAMACHLANCLRSWAQLARVTRTGQPGPRRPSIRGRKGDLVSFIDAMNDVSRVMAPRLVADLKPLHFRHLLDVGGGPGTWTIAFLRAVPDAKATLFDLPDVLPIARRHLTAAGLLERVTLAPGSFTAAAPLPTGADLAWVSAIVHMNSRAENRDLFRKVAAALAPGGRVWVRDVFMDESRTRPAEGALFAINMLVNTPAGGTFTFAEMREDLEAAGFTQPEFIRRGDSMDSVIQAVKPG